MDFITNHYSDAITVTQLKAQIEANLSEFGFDTKKTTWGTSLCSDEVTNTFNVFSPLFVGPGPFRFGGISGMPFTGKTGVLAFASHIPTNGNAFILYGPHIGISSEGITGEILREKQEHKSTGCGSLIAGLNSIETTLEDTPVDLTDPQQNRVKQILFSNKERIFNSENRIKEVTEVTYSKIHSKMHDIISLSEEAFKGTKVYLMGGIVINTDWDKEDCFEIRHTELLDFS